MANKDWDSLYQDIQPEQPTPLTPKQKRRNWWHYHKWHVAVAAVLLAVAADVGKSALGIGEIRPDYQFAYVGSSALPEDTAAALETSLAALGEDCNGDGRVVVQLNQYIAGGTMEGDAEYTYASQVTLMGDLEDCDSYFFILEDAETFQRNYEVLADAGGILPEEGAGPACSLCWGDCPVLAGLELGEYNQVILGQQATGASQELLQSLRIARRGFWEGGKVCAYREQCDALWGVLTKGAAA